jgi:hypothetical protein
LLFLKDHVSKRIRNRKWLIFFIKLFLNLISVINANGSKLSMFKTYSVLRYSSSLRLLNAEIILFIITYQEINKNKILKFVSKKYIKNKKLYVLGMYFY